MYREARLTGRTGVGSLSRTISPVSNNLLDLPLQPRREIGRVVQLEEVPAHRVFQVKAPEVEQRLVDEREATLAAKLDTKSTRAERVVVSTRAC